MNFFRKRGVNANRRQSDTSASSSRSPNNEFESMEQLPETAGRQRSRTISLGNIFPRRRSKHSPAETYERDFWERNFSEKSIVSWNEFRAAFVLDYKTGLEEFSNTGHLNCVLEAAHDELCNKESIVYISRYKKFIGPDPSPDAMWFKIKEDAMRRVFEEGIMDSLCL